MREKNTLYNEYRGKRGRTMDSGIDAIYGRQSIDKKDSISIESQFEFCRYELKGGEGKEYKDKGNSGKDIERPDFQRLLQDIRLGLIKRVIVYKLDQPIYRGLRKAHGTVQAVRCGVCVLHRKV